MSTNLVFVNSIPRPMANGMHEWENTSSGVKLLKTKVGRTADEYRAMRSERIGGLANYISYTPWIENGAPVTDENGNALMLQDKLEKKWNLPKGYLHNRPAPKGPVKDEDLSYWQAKTWRFGDGATVLNLNTLDGEMGYYMCLASSKIANSEKEWREHKWPSATHYIAHFNESEELKYKNNAIKSKAFAALHSNDLTDIYKRKFVSLLGRATTRDALTGEQVHNLLYDYIDTTSFTVGSNVDKFMELVNMLQTATGREELEARYLLKEAIDTRIIFERGGTYTWVRPVGPLVIGERFGEAIAFLTNPSKAPEIDELREMIKVKTL